MSRPAVFLDRDGTLIRERGFLTDPAQVEVLPGVVRALQGLRGAGFIPVVVTNQSGVARGLLGEADLARIHRHLHRELGGLPAAYFHCPHHPDAGTGRYTGPCGCRKPGAGLLYQAAEILGLELSGSFLVGDSARDILAARSVPLKAVLVRTGTPWHAELDRLRTAGVAPDRVSEDLAQAVAWILAQGP